MRSPLGIFVLALVISGCSHQVTLYGRDSGLTAKGSAPASWGYSGELTINLNGKTYTGEWILAAEGSFGILNTYGTNPTFGSVSSFGGSSVGNAILTAGESDILRCEFRYSEWSSTGLGVCQLGSMGEIFDMQIKY